MRSAYRTAPLPTSTLRGSQRRQEHDEGGALAVAGPHRDPAAEQLRQLLRDAETEARAAVAGRGLRVHLLEVRSQRPHVLVPDADAGVPDEQHDTLPASSIVRRLGEERELAEDWVGRVATAADLDSDRAVLGELERVADQVVQDLLDLLPVA